VKSEIDHLVILNVEKFSSVFYPAERKNQGESDGGGFSTFTLTLEEIQV
jgi:hypothetical protein